MKAAIYHGPEQVMTIEDVEIDAPKGREVRVRTVASGVCHSDLHFIDGAHSFRRPRSWVMSRRASWRKWARTCMSSPPATT